MERLVKKWDFASITEQFPTAQGVVRPLGQFLILGPGTSYLLCLQDLDSALRSKKLSVTLTLLRGSLAKPAFELRLQSMDDADNQFEALLLGSPASNYWGFLSTGMAQPRRFRGAQTRAEDGWGTKHTMTLSLNSVGDGESSAQCYRDDKEVGDAIGVEVQSFLEHSDVELILKNHSSNDIRIHSVELWSVTDKTPESLEAASAGITTDHPVSGELPDVDIEKSSLQRQPSPKQDSETSSAPLTPTTVLLPIQGQQHTSGHPPSSISPDTLAAVASPSARNDPGALTNPRGWRAGVSFAHCEERKVIPGHSLPAPRYTRKNGSQGKLFAGDTWEAKQTAMVEVRVGLIVFQTEEYKYLVVRAAVFSNGALVQDGGKHRGFYQDSIEIALHPATVASGPPVTFELEDAGTCPKGKVLGDIDVKRASEQVTSRTLGANLGASIGAPKGPVASSSVAASLSSTNRKLVEQSGFRSAFQSVQISTDAERVQWKKRLAMCANGESYPFKEEELVDGQDLPPLPQFAVDRDGFEAQGTWAFNKNFQGKIGISLAVKQGLRYAAVLRKASTLKKQWKIRSSEDVVQKDWDFQIDTSKLDAVADSAELPPWRS